MTPIEDIKPLNPTQLNAQGRISDGPGDLDGIENDLLIL